MTFQSRRMPAVHLALLRGINLGGKHKVPMKDLSRIFMEAGCSNIRTYIQSGNVIFQCAQSTPEQIVCSVNSRIEERFGFQTPVVLRTGQQMRDVLKDNPYLRARAPENQLHVLFLTGVPDPRRVAELDPPRSAPDTFQVHGEQIYLHLPNGTANSKLTNAYFDSKLATIGTVRNWRTVTTLIELMEERQEENAP